MGIVGVVQRAFGRSLGLEAVTVIVGGVIRRAAGIGHREPLPCGGIREAYSRLIQTRVGHFAEQPIQSVIVVRCQQCIEVRLRGQVPH